MLAERAPGSSLDTLIGALGEGEPKYLAERHDEYLASYPSARRYWGTRRRSGWSATSINASR